MELVMEVFHERAEQEEWLLQKHPWYPILMNWFGAILIAILCIASIVYWIQGSTVKKGEKMVAEARATWEEAQAEAKAADEAEAERIRLRLQPGDRVVMVSDGVENPQLASCAEKSPGELAEGILQAAMAGGCGDDMTVMVCAVMENEK